MNEELIYLKDSEIIINTLSLPDNSFRGKKTFKINDQEISIEKIEQNNSDFLKNIPYSANKLLLKISLKVFNSDNNYSFQLKCRNDEYFFAIQDYFLQVQDYIDYDNEFLDFNSPRIEILTHSEGINHVEAKINKRQLKYLLNIEESIFLPIKKCFYIVLNKFRSSPSEKGLFKLIKEGDLSFRKEKLTSENTIDDDKPIAIIVHGLVSSIGASYFYLFNSLQKDYNVFGFDYLTVNERIRDNAMLLANEVNNLKKKYPNKEILIVSHSMGGLVSRSAYIEFNAPIDKIIMAGTPNNGAILISVPMLARSCLIVYGRLNKLFGKTSIKSEDFWQLVRSKTLVGFNDLANNSDFVSELNASDFINNNKKYFALVGKNFGFSNDGIVHTNNMVTINEIKIPHISNGWNHFTYFNEKEIEYYVERAIMYLK